MRNFNVWVTAIGGIVLLFAMMMLFRATYSIRLTAECLGQPHLAHAHLESALRSIKYGIMGIPFGAGLAMIGIIGRFRRYLEMLEAEAEIEDAA
ncbi:MAG TPA: hypothetical protein PLU30_02480 [Verrucomicrobiae bacterium]|nr:hypothetical protein [Verrucomicrobiae bacterium]